MCNVACCAFPAEKPFFQHCAVPLMYVPVPSENTTKNSCTFPSQTVFTASYLAAVLLNVKSWSGVSGLSAMFCLIGD
jgi:hypothetical protein